MTQDKGHGPTIVVTHGDVDGMVCAAQLIRREKSDCDVVFSNARWIASKLGAVLRARALPPRVYVTDIPADEKAASVVEKLAERSVGIWWVDHHPWPDGLVDRLGGICHEVIYNEAMSTPAGVLLGRWLAEEDPYCDKLGQICYAYEKGTPWERDWFCLLASYTGRSGRDVLERLAYDRPFTAEDRQRIDQQVESKQQAEEILAQKPRVEETAAGTMAVYDLSDKQGVYLGKKVFKNHRVDYCLIRISTRKWQVASRPGSGLSLRALTGLHDLDGTGIRVEGRPNRLLAIELDRKAVPADAHEELIAWVQGKL